MYANTARWGGKIEHRRSFLTSAAAFGLLGCEPRASSPPPAPTRADIALIPAGYPPSYARTIAAARAEGGLSIYSATDAREVAPLLADFAQAYPFIPVDYADLNSTELYSRFIAEVAAHESGADLLWSSAMDLQIKLAADGYAQPYRSPEASALRPGAIWNDTVYGVTAEPIVFAYNARLLSPQDAPQDHADLTRLLAARPDFYRGKVTSYNPERSGVGFLYLSQDIAAYPEEWRFVTTLAATDPKFYTSSGAMMEKVISGEHLLAFNMIGSYALNRRARDPSLGIVMPSDYTLVMSRLAFVARDARRPNAAKLFLDFMLSRRGQAHLAGRFMGPIRDDVTGPAPPPNPRAIPISEALLADLDQLTRLDVLRRWRAAMAAQG